MLAEYVKVCSLYGAGFYYIPGTDICLKVGAYFRAEYAWGNQATSLTNLDNTGPDGQRTRITGPDYQQRARAFVFLDSRQQTAYGTLRAYMNIGWTDDFPNGQTAGGTSAAGVYANRAFMQLAGFTWGVATSYYDFFSSPATSFSVPWSSDTGDGGWKVAAYTAQLGNGVSASFSVEEPRRQDVVNASFNDVSTGAFAPGAPGSATAAAVRSGDPYLVGALPTPDMGKIVWPDLVGNLRVDQAWGSAQIMGAIHQVAGGYYGTSLTGAVPNGHPQDKVGFAIGAGIKINFPMIGPGDYFQGQVNYTEGASRYAMLTPAGNGSPGIFGSPSEIGVGYIADATYCGTSAVTAGATCAAAGFAGPTALQLTTVWGVDAAYEHFWTPALRTSLVGAYNHISYNQNAEAMMCSAHTLGSGTGAQASNSIVGNVGGATFSAFCAANRDAFDWSYWSVSSRTQWNITKDFYVGLEGYYGHLNTMGRGQTVNYQQLSGATQPSGVRTLQDQDVFVYRMRVHRDLVP